HEPARFLQVTVRFIGLPGHPEAGDARHLAPGPALQLARPAVRPDPDRDMPVVHPQYPAGSAHHRTDNSRCVSGSYAHARPAACGGPSVSDPSRAAHRVRVTLAAMAGVAMAGGL